MRHSHKTKHSHFFWLFVSLSYDLGSLFFCLHQRWGWRSRGMCSVLFTITKGKKERKEKREAPTLWTQYYFYNSALWNVMKQCNSLTVNQQYRIIQTYLIDLVIFTFFQLGGVMQTETKYWLNKKYDVAYSSIMIHSFCLQV